MNIVLASASPRRREILQQLDITFEVLPADVDESSNEQDAAALVRLLSHRKACATRALLEQQGRLQADTVIIGCDTVVCCDGCILGKPQDEADAARMLSMLGGKGHTVISGLTVLCGDACVSDHEVTRVFFDTLSPADIAAYIATGEPSDKAGAYAIQGKAGRFIRGIEGDYFNVVGLPVHLLFDAARRLGIEL